MKALSIRQPFAGLIMAGDPRVQCAHVKTWESRPASLPAGMANVPFAVHATKGSNALADMVWQILGDLDLPGAWRHVFTATGKILGVASVDLQAPIHAMSTEWIRRIVSGVLSNGDCRRIMYGVPDRGPMRQGYRLAGVRALINPVAARGMPGWWDIEPEAMDRLYEEGFLLTPEPGAKFSTGDSEPVTQYTHTPGKRPGQLRLL